MLEKTRITDIFDRLGTPPVGRKLVVDVRMHAPVRKVRSTGGSVITWFAGRKMGRESGTESRRIEFAAAIDKEHDGRVLEYYPQPCELKLELVDDRTGEFRTIHHTPDFLIIASDGITLEEWKSDTKLMRLAER